jgi:tRNA (guanosine-2'-O-)-methyltransferase
VSSATKASPRDLRKRRRVHSHGCWDHLIAAPLWVAYEANLGTLARTCDAVGACLAVPATAHYRAALERGDTLARSQRPHLHWVHGPRDDWVRAERAGGTRVVAVELAEGAVPLTRLEPTRQRTIVLAGHEHHGVPAEVLDDVDQVIEIPMIGAGSSLNVAVAVSLVLYRLAGLS